jgi:hypothetical protein
MEAHKISVKFFVDTPWAVGAHEFVAVFHSWIQLHSVPDHMLIDVADYDHVHNGPGTVLISHEANFSTDHADGRLGLMYLRKQPAAGAFADRLRQAFIAAMEACIRLEEDPRLSGRIKFRTDEALLKIHDRLLAPNTAETMSAVKPDLQRLAAQLYPVDELLLEHTPSPDAMFEVRIKVPSAPDLTTLLSRLR